MPGEQDHIRTILDAVERIGECRRADTAANATHDASHWEVVLHLQVIAHASRSISPSARSRWSQVPWSLLVTVGAILDRAGLDVHGQEVWETAQQDIPELKRRLETIAAKPQ